METATSPRDAAAARVFPAEWAEASGQTGKRAQNRRANLRRRAEYEIAMEPLRAAGRSCAGCDSYSDAPHGACVAKICDAESDFHGYVEARPDGLCPKWAPR